MIARPLDSILGEVPGAGVQSWLGGMLGANLGSSAPGPAQAVCFFQGNINRQLSGAGINPAATGSDIVLAVYSIPANSFDAAGVGVNVQAMGAIVNNANTKRVKIIFNPTAAVVGQTVTGGTTIADTGSVTTVGGGFYLSSSVYKTGAVNSNTQVAVNTDAQIGATADALLAPVATTAVEAGNILVAITGAAGTAVTDIALNAMIVNGQN